MLRIEMCPESGLLGSAPAELRAHSYFSNALRHSPEPLHHPIMLRRPPRGACPAAHGLRWEARPEPAHRIPPLRFANVRKHRESALGGSSAHSETTLRT